jgi:hypothetical protein
MVGLRDTGIIMFHALRGCPMSSSGKCSIRPQRLVVGDTSLRQERERVPSLCAWMRAAGAHLVGMVCVVRSLFFVVLRPLVYVDSLSFYSSRRASVQGLGW